MIFMADTSEDLSVIEAEIGTSVEQLLTPRTRFRLQDEERCFGIDNGCFAGFDEDAFSALLDREGVTNSGRVRMRYQPVRPLEGRRTRQLPAAHVLPRQQLTLSRIRGGRVDHRLSVALSLPNIRGDRQYVTHLLVLQLKTIDTLIRNGDRKAVTWSAFWITTGGVLPGSLAGLWHLTARECPRDDLGGVKDEDIDNDMKCRGDVYARSACLVCARWTYVEDHRLLVRRVCSRRASARRNANALHVRGVRARNIRMTVDRHSSFAASILTIRDGMQYDTGQFPLQVTVFVYPIHILGSFLVSKVRASRRRFTLTAKILVASATISRVAVRLEREQAERVLGKPADRARPHLSSLHASQVRQLNATADATVWHRPSAHEAREHEPGKPRRNRGRSWLHTTSVACTKWRESRYPKPHRPSFGSGGKQPAQLQRAGAPSATTVTVMLTEESSK